MTRLASTADYKREIAELEQLIEQEHATAESLGDDFSSRVARQSLQNRLADLRHRLATLSDADLPGHELDLVLSGGPVSGESVDADFLGRILQKVQALVHSLVNAQFGRLTQHGSWPEDVLRRSSLQVAQTFPGSFGVKLETVDEQLELEGMLAIEPAFRDLFEIVSSRKEGADYLAELAPVGARARRHLRTLLTEVSKADAKLELRWPLVDGEKRAEITPSRAKDLARLLKNIDEEDYFEDRVGLLEGAILRTGFFELQQDDGSVVSGRISPDIQTQVTDLFGARVRATLLVTKVKDKGTGLEKETYRLMRLSRDDGAG